MPLPLLTGLPVRKLWICFRPLATILFLLLLNACSLPEIKQQAEVVEDAAMIEGRVQLKTGRQAPVHVLLFRQARNDLVLDAEYVLPGAGTFRFYPLPGDYFLAAFQDIDADGRYQRSEPAVVYGQTGDSNGELITLIKDQRYVVDALLVESALTNTSSEDNVQFRLSNDHTGEIISLDDQRFSREVASLGLWMPISFLEQQGPGLYQLEDYDAQRIPIIFIHGASGSPRDFSAMIEGLDRERYQPWVLHYPSGVRLDMVSDYLVKSMNRLQASYQFRELAVVAHSMGGLVMRSMVMKYTQTEGSASIVFAVSINSPMTGLGSAAHGVSVSPVVVSSWRDLATGSDYIKNLKTWAWPDTIPYYVVFSYESGSGDDGVVRLESQIPQFLQDEASRIYGFNSQHESVLADPFFLARFNQLLAIYSTKP